MNNNTMAMYYPAKWLALFRRDKSSRSHRKNVLSVFFDDAASSYNINSQSLKTKQSVRTRL